MDMCVCVCVCVCVDATCYFLMNLREREGQVRLEPLKWRWAQCQEEAHPPSPRGWARGGLSEL